MHLPCSVAVKNVCLFDIVGANLNSTCTHVRLSSAAVCSSGPEIALDLDLDLDLDDDSCV